MAVPVRRDVSGEPPRVPCSEGENRGRPQLLWAGPCFRGPLGSVPVQDERIPVRSLGTRLRVLAGNPDVGPRSNVETLESALRPEAGHCECTPLTREAGTGQTDKLPISTSKRLAALRRRVKDDRSGNHNGGHETTAGTGTSHAMSPYHRVSPGRLPRPTCLSSRLAMAEPWR